MAKLTEVIRYLKANGAKGKRFTNREKWLEARVLGSSDSSAICGVNPYRTPYMVWAELTGLRPKADLSGNEAVEWGNTLEPVIALQFAKKTGLEIVHNEFLFWREDAVHLTATPDYFVKDEKGDWGILEIKNTGEYHASDWENGVPDNAQTQVNHQMLVIPGIKFSYVCGLIGGNKLRFRRFEKDPELEAILKSNLDEFWQLVITNQPPELTAKDDAVINGIYSTPTRDTGVALEDAYETFFARYLEVTKEIAVYEKEKDALKAQIKNLIKEHKQAVCGKYQATWDMVEYKESTRPAMAVRVLKVKPVGATK